MKLYHSLFKTGILIFLFQANLLSQTLEFKNPIAKQRADPWVIKTDSTYYLIATVTTYDKIVIRKANIINGLKTAKETIIWKKHDKGV